MKGEIISSLNNETIKLARSLLDKKDRKINGKFLIDGEKLVREVIKSQIKVCKIFVDSEKKSAFDYILQEFDGEIIFVTTKVLASLSENQTPQGIIAECKIPKFEEFGKNLNEPILVLDRIQDPGNMGTMIRTALATGIFKIVLIDCVDAYSPKVVRSSANAILFEKIYKLSEDEVIEYYKNSGIQMLIADMAGENIYKMKKPTQNFALVIGNEGQGVSEKLLNCGKVISLPMNKNSESLNAGVCASILMYELLGDKI